MSTVARTSKETTKSVGEIGEELGIEYVLQGTVRWQQTSDGSSRVRVTPQLIRVADATSVWAEIYHKQISDIFEVQSDIPSLTLDGRLHEFIQVTGESTWVRTPVTRVDWGVANGKRPSMQAGAFGRMIAAWLNPPRCTPESS